MDWERSFHEQVNSKIESWADRNKEPPFTQAQLVVMALVVNQAPMTMEAIHEWLMERLCYYRKLAFKYWWKLGQNREAEEEEARKHQRSFLIAFHQLEVPIWTVKVGKDLCWTVSTSEARIFLKPIFEDENEIRGQPFPFMRLPFEIRLRIYELILTLPRIGVRFGKPLVRSGDDWRTEIITVQRSALRLEAHEAWFHRYLSGLQLSSPYSNMVSSEIRCSRPASLFAIFLVDRTVYKEAMPVFFDINLFVFFGPEDMVDRLLSLPIDRRKHVRHVLLPLQTSPHCTSLIRRPAEFASKIRVLRSCTGLAKIDVHVEGSKDWASPHLCRATAKTKMTSLMSILTIFGLQRTNLLGDCLIVKEKLAAGLSKWEAVEKLGRDMICE